MATMRIHAACQITLTQMFGGKSKDTELETDLPVTEEEFETVDCASHAETAKEEHQSQVDDASIDTATSYALVSEEEDRGAVARRVLWRNGSICDTGENQGDGTNRAVSVWGNLVATALQREQEIEYGSAFNKLFAIGATDNLGDPGFEHLLGLFEETSSLQSSQANRTPSPAKKPSHIDISMLTQRGVSRAQAIQDLLSANKDKLSSLEAVCPNWKESVAYAMRQRDPDKLNDAVENVRKSKARLAKMKENFLKAMREQETVLDVFELALQESRKRLLENEESSPMPGSDIFVESPVKRPVSST